MEKSPPTRPTPYLFFFLFLVFASVILGDNVSDSLLLSNFDPGVVPVMFIVNAVFLFIISLFFINLIDRTDRGRLMIAVLLIHVVCLLAIRGLVAVRFVYVYPFLYSYAYSSKMILFLTFWTMANDLVSAREAKIRFPRIAAGGVTGGILISFSVVFFMKVIPAEELLLVWAGLIGLTLPLAFHIHRRYGDSLRAVHAPAGGKSRLAQRMEDFHLIRNEALLGRMAQIYFVTFMLLFAHDYIFLSSLKETFMGARDYFLHGMRSDLLQGTLYGDEGTRLILKKEIPTFLGIFKGVSNLVTILLQVTVAGLILKKMGTVRSTLVMPLLFIVTYSLLLLAKLGVLPQQGPAMYPFFGSALFLVVLGSIALRIAVFDSIYSPNFQIFFSAMAKEIRGRGKIFIEGIIKPVAILSAGLFILFVFNKALIPSLCLLLALSIFLLFQCLSIKKSYSESIVRSLGGDRTDRIQKLLELKVEGAGGTGAKVLSEFLNDPDPQVSDFAAATLARMGSDPSLRLLQDHFERSDETGRVHLLQILSDSDVRDLRFLPIFERGLVSSASRTVILSVHALSLVAPPEFASRLRPLLRHPEPEVRAVAAGALWPSASSPERADMKVILEGLLSIGDRRGVQACVSALGDIADEGVMPLLERALVHPVLGIERNDPDGLRLAVLTLSRFPGEEPARRLLGLAVRADFHLLPLLEKGLADHLPGYPVLAVRALSDPDLRIRSLAIRSLEPSAATLLPPVRSALKELLDNELRRMVRLKQLASILRAQASGDPAEVLTGAVEENLVRRNLATLTILLSALHPGSRLRAVADKVISRNRHERANALEVIENGARGRAVRLLLDLCDEVPVERLVAEGRSLWHFDDPSIYFVLRELYGQGDAWIQALTLYAARDLAQRQKSDQAFRALELTEAQISPKLTELIYG